jgi:Tfp pilus assembly protein PilW
MRLCPLSRRGQLGMTLVELMISMGIGTAILAAFTVASVALQRSFTAIEDYAKGQNDQMRISDFLSLDMRRAFSIAITGDTAHPPVTVTMVIPNFYQSANTPYDPYVVGVSGWPYKKHHHHKHQNIILNQIVQYGPYDSVSKTVTTPTLTVTYVFNSSSSTLTRNVNGVPTTIATDVKDFSVAISDMDETAQTQITFQPRFTNPASAAAVTGTTYFQTTLTRNTR